MQKTSIITLEHSVNDHVYKNGTPAQVVKILRFSPLAGDCGARHASEFINQSIKKETFQCSVHVDEWHGNQKINIGFVNNIVNVSVLRVCLARCSVCVHCMGFEL